MSKLAACPYTVNQRWSFLDMAAEEAEKSKCDRSKVGSALVTPDARMIFVACNEVSPGHGEHTCKDFCPRGAKSYEELPYGSEPMTDCNSLHAEFAVIRRAMEHKVEETGLDALRTDEEALKAFFEGWWMFSTKEPCNACKLYVQALGIRYQWATSWKRRVVREGVFVVDTSSREGSGNASGSAGNAN